MKARVDLIFSLSVDHARDCARLERLLGGPVEVANVLLLGNLGPPGDALQTLLSKSPLRWHVVQDETNTAGLNRALLLSEHDTLIVPWDAVPTKTCLEELMAAGAIHDRVAAVTAVPQVSNLDEDAARAASELPRAVEIPAPDTGMVLLKRQVMNMAGALDLAFPLPPEALADWCQRAQRLGFLTVRALRAWFESTREAKFADAELLRHRHRAYTEQRLAAESDVTRRLPQQVLSLARGELSVCLDVRYLPADAINGSRVYAMELGRALQQHTGARVSWLVTAEPQRRALEQLGMPVYLQGTSMPAFDLVHRPAQVFVPRDLAWLLRAQAPFVITYQDLIAYRAASAFPSPEEHQDYRLVSHLALRSAQGVIAISDHNRTDLLQEFDLPGDHVRVVHHGVHAERFANRNAAENRAVLDSLRVPERFFLYVGSDYAHKNLRLLMAAYATFRALSSSSGAPPMLVIAGHASGTVDGLFPRLREVSPAGVLYLGEVSDAAIEALYQETLALLFISAYEGFGLPILEAMAAGAPVLCSRLSSIPEVAGDAGLYVDDLTDVNIAQHLSALAGDAGLRKRHAMLGIDQARRFTWAETARRTFEAYERALRAPSMRSLHERRAAATIAARLFA